jgi:hypothetical protein
MERERGKADIMTDQANAYVGQRVTTRYTTRARSITFWPGRYFQAIAGGQTGEVLVQFGDECLVDFGPALNEAGQPTGSPGVRVVSIDALEPADARKVQIMEAIQASREKELVHA